jgi:hypothetical protein
LVAGAYIIVGLTLTVELWLVLSIFMIKLKWASLDFPSFKLYFISLVFLTSAYKSLVNYVLLQWNKMHSRTWNLIMFWVYANWTLFYLKIELMILCFIPFAAVKLKHMCVIFSQNILELLNF